MKTDETHQVSVSEVRGNHLSITFEDGQSAIYTASFLYSALGLARILHEAEIVEEDVDVRGSVVRSQEAW